MHKLSWTFRWHQGQSLMVRRINDQSSGVRAFWLSNSGDPGGFLVILVPGWPRIFDDRKWPEFLMTGNPENYNSRSSIELNKRTSMRIFHRATFLRCITWILCQISTKSYPKEKNMQEFVKVSWLIILKYVFIKSSVSTQF